jgi:hypothetical protein
MTSHTHNTTSAGQNRDDLASELATAQGALRDVLDQLARVEGELARYRAAAQVEARRGY